MNYKEGDIILFRVGTFPVEIKEGEIAETYTNKVNIPIVYKIKVKTALYTHINADEILGFAGEEAPPDYVVNKLKSEL